MTENSGLTTIIVILYFRGWNNGRCDLIKFSSRFVQSNYRKLIGAHTLNTIDTKVGLKEAWTIRGFVSTVTWSMALWLLVCLQSSSVNYFKLFSWQGVFKYHWMTWSKMLVLSGWKCWLKWPPLVLQQVISDREKGPCCSFTLGLIIQGWLSLQIPKPKI